MISRPLEVRVQFKSTLIKFKPSRIIFLFLKSASLSPSTGTSLLGQLRIDHMLQFQQLKSSIRRLLHQIEHDLLHLLYLKLSIIQSIVLFQLFLFYQFQILSHLL